MVSRNEALLGIQKSGILNPKLTISEVMEVAGRMNLADGMGHGEEFGWWAIVGKDFVVAGSGADIEKIANSLQK